MTNNIIEWIPTLTGYGDENTDCVFVISPLVSGVWQLMVNADHEDGSGDLTRYINSYPSQKEAQEAAQRWLNADPKPRRTDDV